MTQHPFTPVLLDLLRQAQTSQNTFFQLKGYIFYNLACFYATHTRLEQAASALQQAFTLYPETREFARTDPDLAALRPHQPE